MRYSMVCSGKVSNLWTRGQFLGHNWDKSLKNFLLAIHSHLYYGFTPPPPPPSKSGLKLVCNVNIVYGNLSLRTLQIVPRNLNEFVRSWIRLQKGNDQWKRDQAPPPHLKLESKDTVSILIQDTNAHLFQKSQLIILQDSSLLEHRTLWSHIYPHKVRMFPCNQRDI